MEAKGKAQSLPSERLRAVLSADPPEQHRKHAAKPCVLFPIVCSALRATATTLTVCESNTCVNPWSRLLGELGLTRPGLPGRRPRKGSHLKAWISPHAPRLYTRGSLPASRMARASPFYLRSKILLAPSENLFILGDSELRGRNLPLKAGKAL